MLLEGIIDRDCADIDRLLQHITAEYQTMLHQPQQQQQFSRPLETNQINQTNQDFLFHLIQQYDAIAKLARGLHATMFDIIANNPQLLIDGDDRLVPTTLSPAPPPQSTTTTTTTIDHVRHQTNN